MNDKFQTSLGVLDFFYHRHLELSALRMPAQDTQIISPIFLSLRIGVGFGKLYAPSKACYDDLREWLRLVTDLYFPQVTYQVMRPADPIPS